MAAEESADVSPKIEELLALLADPAVQQWLEAQRSGPTVPSGVEGQRTIPQPFWQARLDFIRNHLADLAVAAGRLPAELARDGRTCAT
jgi:hypothetical protein